MLYLPALQAVHTSDVVAKSAELYAPAAHCAQSDAAAPLLNLPAAHAVHDCDVVDTSKSLYVPTSHAKQPPPDWYVPLPHAVQNDELVAAVTLVYWPVPHEVHAAEVPATCTEL